MNTFTSAVARFLRRPRVARDVEPGAPGSPLLDDVHIPPNDPIVAYFQDSVGTVDIDKVALDSPGAQSLRQRGIKLVVPLVNQGELMGLLNVGPRRSEQDYSADDRHLLESLAGHVAPAVMVAQLVRQHEIEATARERFEQELRVAQLIQQNLLPRSAPQVAGWQLSAYYQPAREVGGDFYDFIHLEHDRLALVIGDVTDKGVPAALVMASTRSILRAVAQPLSTPGQVLERANDLLCPDMPANMFVTCLYCIVDLRTGGIVFANAGHNLPNVHTSEGAYELRASGMPLGLMPGMKYEEREAEIRPGESVLLHTDGLAEAHNPEREMFGFPRLLRLVGEHGGGRSLIAVLRSELESFTGPDQEQEDDVTLVLLARDSQAVSDPNAEIIGEFRVPSAPGNEQLAIDGVTAALQERELSDVQVDRVRTAVGEAVMNAMEHGNRYRSDLPVVVTMSMTSEKLKIAIKDSGEEQPIPEAQLPDLEAKLAGMQPTRGWGLFLIQNMVDEMRTSSDETGHTMELLFSLRAGTDG